MRNFNDYFISYGIRTASAPRIANAITISVTLRLAGVNVPYFMVNNIVLNESLVGCNLIRIFVLSPLPFAGVDVDVGVTSATATANE